MDLEQLIEEAINDKANSVVIELPPFDNIWESASRHKRYLPRKRFNLKNFSIVGWLEIAVILVMLTVLPTVITSLRNSTSEEVKPSSMQSALSSTDLEEAKKVGIDFLNQLNTFADYKTFKETDYILYPNDNRTKSFRIYLTEDYYSEFVANRNSLLIPNTATILKSSVKLDSVSLDKYSEDFQNKLVVFNFETVTKFTQESTLKEDLVIVKGQITIKKQDGSWKVKLYYPRSADPNDWFNLGNPT